MRTINERGWERVRETVRDRDRQIRDRELGSE